MSIVRWGEEGSNVYIIGIDHDRWDCVGCDLYPDATTADLTKFIAHLNRHRQAGHTVPAWVEEALKYWTYDEEFADQWPNPEPWLTMTYSEYKAMNPSARTGLNEEA